MRATLLLLLLSSALSAQEVIISSQIGGGEATLSSFSPIAGSPIALFRGNFMPADPLGMLQQKQIQEELDLSDDQIAVVKELQKDISRQTQEIFSAGAKFGGDATRLMETAQKAIRESVEKELKEVLAHKQLTRLGQLEVQMKIRNRGALALMEGRIAEALNVSDEQKESIREDHRERQRELQEEIEKLRQRHRKRLIKELLSDEQLTKLEQLSGDEYEVKEINRRRFPGGPR